MRIIFKRLVAIFLCLIIFLTNLSYNTLEVCAASLSWTFTYTGSVQTFTVPFTGEYNLNLYGAQGANGKDSDGVAVAAARGMNVSGNIYLEAGDILYIYVGGQGSGAYGGWNGGGNGAGSVTNSYNANGISSSSSGFSGGGGGATDIRLIAGAWNNSESLQSRILVAGGGAGAGCSLYAGYRDGTGVSGGHGLKGLGPGSNGVLGRGSNFATSGRFVQRPDSLAYHERITWTGGGGGGYYGGKTTASSGSQDAFSFSGTNYYNSSLISNYKANTGTSTVIGAKSGNGKAVITALNTRTVTLNKGTGIDSVSGAGIYGYGQSATIDATVSAGYHWNNWTGSATYQNKSNTFIVDDDKTFTANAIPNQYTISFDGNDATGGSTASMSCTYDVEYTLTENGFTRTGYQFKNWNTKADGTGTTYANKASVKNLTTTDNGTVTLYAQWTPNTYYVDYYKGLTNNGGTTNKTTHTYDADVTLAVNGFVGMSYSLSFNENKPKDDYDNVTVGTVTGLQSTKSGRLSFKNWFITDAHNNNNTYASANTNLGKKNYRTDNGGTASATAQWNPITLSNFKSPSLTGYKFNGYYTASSGGTKITTITINPSTTAYSNTLYAQWSPVIYKIRFNGNGNWNTSQGSYTQDCAYDKHIELMDTKFTRADATTYNSTYYERGYEFIGWGTSTTQKSPTYLNKQTVYNLTTDEEIIDLYALWKKEITLTIDFNGGKFNNDSTPKVSSYTLYNSEWNHTFDIKQYYGTINGNGFNNKGLNNKLTKTDSKGFVK